MKLKILSTIAAISATATSASSLTCGDVQALYQDGECCSANGQSCVKSLSIAAGSNGGLTLSNNGELNLDLSTYDTTLANKLSINSVEGGLWHEVPSNLKTTRLWNAGTFDLEGKGSGEWTGCIGCSDSGLLWNSLAAVGNSDFRLGQTSLGAPDHSDKFGKTVFLALGAKHQISSFAPQINFHGSSTFHAHPDGGNSGYVTNFNNRVFFNGADIYVRGEGGEEIMKVEHRPNQQYGLTTDKQVLMRKGANGKTLYVKEGETLFAAAATVKFEGVVSSNSAIEFTSDSRIKKDIVDADIEDALQKVLDIELKEYGYTDPIKEGEKTVGFIAQQVKEVYPDAIRVSDSEEDIWNEAGEKVQISDLHRIKKDKIYALHHGAIQSLVAKIAALEARLAALEAQPEPTPEQPEPTPEA
jgi:hypothetical protein